MIPYRALKHSSRLNLASLSTSAAERTSHSVSRRCIRALSSTRLHAGKSTPSSLTCGSSVNCTFTRAFFTSIRKFSSESTHPSDASSAIFSPTPSPPRLGMSRVWTVFLALLTLGVGTTAYGLYDFYSSLTLWPPEIRSDLRAGIKARNQGDLDLSAKFLQRALTTSYALPHSVLAPYTHLKRSGIAITLANVLEDNNQPKAAYNIYVDTLARLQAAQSPPALTQAQASGSPAPSPSPASTQEPAPVMAEPDPEPAPPLTGPERVRAVAIASKLGAMAGEYRLSREDEQRWLEWAVEEVLRIVREGDEVGGRAKALGGETQLVLAGLDLPSWVSRIDVGAPLEALGAFYAREGKAEYAIPLYLQAASILIPPPGAGKTSSPEDRCRGAELMNNLAELLVRDISPGNAPERVHQAEAWARQARGVIEKTQEKNKGLSVCETALVAVLFNLGSLREMSDDRKSARELFASSLAQSERIKMKEGMLESKRALRRLDRLDAQKSASKDGP